MPGKLKAFIMKDSHMGGQLEKMKHLIVEENLFDHIEEELNNFEDENPEMRA